MSSDSNDDMSSSDEEYIPPTKTAKKDQSSDSSDSEDGGDSDDPDCASEEVAAKSAVVTEKVQIPEPVGKPNTTHPADRPKCITNLPSPSTEIKPVNTPSRSTVAKGPSLFSSPSLKNALQNLKSLGGNKTPKLTTLDKSRLDWQNFVEKEKIEEDLKAHNKGKQGYLERRAFVDRTSEREYKYERSMTSRKL